MDGDKEIDLSDKRVTLWMDNEDSNLAEAACVSLAGVGAKSLNSVSCTTRILKQEQRNIWNGFESQKPINVLSILIDPISRQQFQQTMPRTAQLLNDRGFVSFKNQIVVGGNSGPNQAALFTGVPLSRGRNGINSSSSHEKSTRWLWDTLEGKGYVT